LSIIALLTDFGTSDWFTGETKGVLFGIAPNVHIVDITHQIAPGDIRSGAFALKASYKSFPLQTIFCVPIDPDTSGSCTAIAIQSDRYTFVGPDNGVLSWAVEDEHILSIVKLTDIRFFRNPLSMTFRGRDIFAPVAAHLSEGVSIKALGPILMGYKHLPVPVPHVTGDTVSGEILYIDRFGNIITNITKELLSKNSSFNFHSSGINQVLPLASTYDSVEQGKAMIYAGSTGFIEIGIHSGSAAKEFRIKCGDTVDFTAL
jgi:S-adenosyl-L-methionine hydrolase (adenosine-forming)